MQRLLKERHGHVATRSGEEAGALSHSVECSRRRNAHIRSPCLFHTHPPMHKHTPPHIPVRHRRDTVHTPVQVVV
jgi:hypothetical protein